LQDSVKVVVPVNEGKLKRTLFEATPFTSLNNLLPFRGKVMEKPGE
jgi:hypothetical protein